MRRSRWTSGRRLRKGMQCRAGGRGKGDNEGEGLKWREGIDALSACTRRRISEDRQVMRRIDERVKEVGGVEVGMRRLIVQQVVLAVKTWSKRRKINEAFRGQFSSSITLSSCSDAEATSRDSTLPCFPTCFFLSFLCAEQQQVKEPPTEVRVREDADRARRTRRRREVTFDPLKPMATIRGVDGQPKMVKPVASLPLQAVFPPLSPCAAEIPTTQLSSTFPPPSVFILSSFASFRFFITKTLTCFAVGAQTTSRRQGRFCFASSASLPWNSTGPKNASPSDKEGPERSAQFLSTFSPSLVCSSILTNFGLSFKLLISTQQVDDAAFPSLERFHVFIEDFLDESNNVARCVDESGDRDGSRRGDDKT
eukprot:763087-Hanusia_phi.AAC.1